LGRSEFFPVALRTSHVGNEDFDGKLRVAPSWADTLLDTIDRLVVLDSSRVVNLVIILWDICDPETPDPDPYNVYEGMLALFGD
jgi:hypothetical protein